MISRPSADLPILVLAVQDPPSGRTLVAVRDRTGSPSAGLESWPRPVPEAALFTYWPSRPRRADRILLFGREVEAHDGASFPLATVLDRLGLAAPRRLADLIALLAPDLESPEDPSHLGVRLLEGLALRLAAAEERPEAEDPRRPGPGIQGVLPVLPESPGVYTFRAADRTVLYVGKARSLQVRVPSHFGRRPAEPDKAGELARLATELSWETTGSELEALLLEHLRIRTDRPRLNKQVQVIPRRRGPLRTARLLLVLPSAVRGRVEACLVSGTGVFHWERVPGKPVVPRTLWARVAAAMSGSPVPGWGPGRPGDPLDPALAAELSEITLSWLVRHRDRVLQIDLGRESGGKPLQRRIRALLAEDPAGERVDVVGR